MTHRERILAAVGHKAPDRVPVDFGGTGTSTITIGAYERLCAHVGLELSAPPRLFSQRASTVLPDRALVERFDACALPLLSQSPDVRPERVAGPGLLLDEWGVTWKQHEGSHYIPVDGPLMKLDEPEPADLDRIEWPDPLDAGRYRGLREAARALHESTDRAVVLVAWLGPVHATQFLRGYAEWMEDVLLRPAFFEAMLERTADLWIAATTRALEECGDFVDVVMYGDDIGMQRGPAIRPELYRKYIQPRHKRIAAAAKRTGKPLLFHTCGAVASLIPDLIDAGIDALNPVQVACTGMETDRLKREFGRDLAFWGAIDTQRVLPRGTPAEVREEVRRRIGDLNHDGGYVVAPVHNLQADVPPENIVALYEAAREFGG